MANASVQKFLELVKADKAIEADLQKQMMGAGSPEAALEKAASLAKARGFTFTAGELLADLPAMPVLPASGGELSASELEGVSGGRAFWNWAKECTGSTSAACYICAMGTSG